jgi:ATP-dependent DNA helicase RecQ
LLAYFGEEFSGDGCGACDNCLSPRETFDGTVAAQKFLSCIYRVRQKSGFDFGINQITEVLTGANTENVRKWQHETVSTYGKGLEHSRAEWKAIGRELIRLGLIKQHAEKFNALELTDEGLAIIKQRKSVALTKPMKAPEPASHHVGEITCDEILFERLRALRKKLADERDVPAYIVFSDVALRQMARNYPQSESDFARISGVGEKKLREFGENFLAEIASHLQMNPRQVFADDSFTASKPLRKTGMNDTTRDTLRRFRAGESVGKIAADRQFVASTIYGHLAKAIEADEVIDLNQLLSVEAQTEIAAVFARTGWGDTVLARELLGGKYDYGLLWLYRAAKTASLVRR